MDENTIEEQVWQLRAIGASEVEQEMLRAERAAKKAVAAIAQASRHPAGPASKIGTPGYQLNNFLMGQPWAVQAGIMSPQIAQALKNPVGPAQTIGTPGYQLNNFLMNQVKQFQLALVASIGVLSLAMKRAFDEASRFATQTLSLQALAGGTTKEAAGFAIVGRAAGIQDTQVLRDVMRLSESTREPRGRFALGALGINNAGNQDSLALFSQITTKLAGMQDGIRKTQIEMSLFGQRGVAAIQPLLRMTSEQRDIVTALASSVDVNALHSIEQFRVSLGLLGETLLQRVVIPILGLVLPALTQLVNKMAQFVMWVSRMNDMTHGFVGWGAVLAGLAAAIGLVVVAFKQWQIAAKAVAMWEAIVDAFAGNWAALAAGLAVSAAAGAAWYATGGATPVGADIAKNTARTADILEDIRGQMIGGGPRARNMASELEVEYAIAHAFGKSIISGG